MFGMSWTQIIMIVVIGVFLLGPERIPTAVQWVTGSMKKLRGMAQGAQQQLSSELGPEIAEMRRQIAELQGLKELQSLKELKDLNPRAMISKTIFGTDEAKTAGGVAGLLGLDPSLLTDPGLKGVSAGGPAEVTARAAAADAVSFDKGAAAGPAVSDPLPLVGGDEQQVQPAAEPDPMPQVGATVDPLPSTTQPTAPEVRVPDPVPVTPAAVQTDPLPAGAEPAAPADPLPATAPPADRLQADRLQADPLPTKTVPVPESDPLPAASADLLPAPGAAVPQAAKKDHPAVSMPAVAPSPEARALLQQPLVIGGDPLPRVAKPDPIPAIGF